MEAFVFALSAICLSMALSTVDGARGLDHTSVVASSMPCPQAPSQIIEARNNQGPANTRPVVGEAYASFNPDNITEITDEYLFRLAIDEFEARRDSRRPPALDWSSNGCTNAPDDIGTWNFLPACHRHDFGIRNYRQQRRLNKTTKRRIDDQFLEE